MHHYLIFRTWVGHKYKVEGKLHHCITQSGVYALCHPILKSSSSFLVLGIFQTLEMSHLTSDLTASVSMNCFLIVPCTQTSPAFVWQSYLLGLSFLPWDSYQNQQELDLGCLSSILCAVHSYCRQVMITIRRCWCWICMDNFFFLMSILYDTALNCRLT